MSMQTPIRDRARGLRGPGLTSDDRAELDAKTDAASASADDAEASAASASADALAAAVARDQAASLILPQNIFATGTLADAEAAVSVGTIFKWVHDGLSDVRKRTSGGSELLYTEATTAALASPDPDKGAALMAYRAPYADAVPETLAKILGRTVWIEQFGAEANNPAFDNRDMILRALHSGAKTVLAGKGNFFTTPLFPDRRADNVTFLGQGYETCLCLMGDYSGGVGNQRAVLSVAAPGDPYGGGAVEGPHNFLVDQMRFYGGTATGDDATSTVGFRSHSQNGGGFGKIWTHGFTKHGVLIAGAPTDFDGGTLVTFDNGNRPGLTTSAQGIGIACPTITDPTVITLDRVISHENGRANNGFGIDFASGAATVNSISTRDNGISSFKVAGSPGQKIIIGQAVSNNDHAGISSGSPCVWSNADFELLQIGILTVTNFGGGTGLSIKHSGRVKIGTSYFADISGLGIEAGAEGKTIDLDIGSASVYRAGVMGVSMLGSGARLSARYGRIYTEDTEQFGLYSTAHTFHADSFESKNCGTTYAAQFAGTPDSVYVGSAVMHHDTSTTSAMRIVDTVNGTARIVSARATGSYAGAVLDSAGSNILPFSRGASVGVPTGGATVDAEARAKLNELIVSLRAARLIR
ncbi:hypothetical protein sphantq_02926 [Sphingobium sp. AntQ-1]|uniref:hypothetical protein n=1 Tax=Sphingobium sp. AntQ-1 TaxID=2930091 RepID=UPI00234EE83F|nr:hypothetical protein [Sphingobium sp. AntQ-1]WCP14480.1 hypothetical protein sphantq_02926 [Sphingobium sp. AntQ-1]